MSDSTTANAPTISADFDTESSDGFMLILLQSVIQTEITHEYRRILQTWKRTDQAMSALGRKRTLGRIVVERFIRLSAPLLVQT
jgi:hypothetical protein